MLAATRRMRISQMIAEDGQVQVSELAKQLQVSDETIRRDLMELEQQGILQRNYGGAILTHLGQETLPPLEARQSVHQREKALIGRLAATLVGEGQVAILDAGSTTRQVARFLRTVPHLTVITNDLTIADELRSAKGIQVMVTGGYLKPRSRSLIGPEAVAAVRRYHADIAIIGATGISLERGMTASDIFEAEIKSAILQSARRRVVVADHSKLGHAHLATFAPAESIGCLVTGWQAPAPLVNSLMGLGVEVLLTKRPEHRDERK
ncbi:MAG: DeoR/GlpR family DNA-binding transcription regulator [Bacillota bacterium]